MGHWHADDARLLGSAGPIRDRRRRPIVNAIAGDGETTWFEGLLLVGVYVLLALAFFFTGSS